MSKKVKSSLQNKQFSIYFIFSVAIRIELLFRKQHIYHLLKIDILHFNSYAFIPVRMQ